jgi:methylenetetrahydrofolate--tRNA-(uracil-5-)-methyltransferase
MKTVNIIGAGLAGCEAAYFLSKFPIKIKLYEMRPKKMTPAHKTSNFAELVCSNSLRSNSNQNAAGLLKKEMEIFDSLIIKAALFSKVPAGSSLAVDRELFSSFIKDELLKCTNIEFVNEEFVKFSDDEIYIVASGPLTSESLINELFSLFDNQEYLYFYDAIAPIILASSIDFEKCFFKDRYDKGDLETGDYLNCPMNEEEYKNFYEALITAEKYEIKSFEKNYFEGCLPVEEIAKRGEKTLLFGPLKPVGLNNPKTDEKYHAVVQLRRDDRSNELFNIVGFQTHLKQNEQKRVINLIPGLSNAKIVKYGMIHRNTFINSPKLLNQYFQLKKRENIFFAGQITGIEGYVESAASGIISAIEVSRKIFDKDFINFPVSTAFGGIVKHISTINKNYQPSNIIYSLIDSTDIKVKNRRDKKEKKENIYLNSMKVLKELREEIFL